MSTMGSALEHILNDFQALKMSFATIVVVGTFSLLFFQYFIKGFIFTNKKGSYAKLPPVPGNYF